MSAAAMRPTSNVPVTALASATSTVRRRVPRPSPSAASSSHTEGAQPCQRMDREASTAKRSPARSL